MRMEEWWLMWLVALGRFGLKLNLRAYMIKKVAPR